MTTGLGVSLASKKANASLGGKRLRSFSARYSEYPSTMILVSLRVCKSVLRGFP